MPAASSAPSIRLRGVRQNNLKNFDLDLPLNRLIVFTGLSGSGKSSLAFDTLFAEGQRRYIETFSPYARQFFDRMDKPKVDAIEGIPPAIALEQRNSVRTTRSTVGTMTEICDYMKVVWPHLAELHCRQCHRLVRKDNPQSIWPTLPQDREILVAFDLPLSAKLTSEETLDLVRRQGYQRLLIHGRVTRIEDAPAALGNVAPPALTVIQDRLRVNPAARSRFVDACEQAFHFGKGRLSVYPDAANTETFLRVLATFALRRLRPRVSGAGAGPVQFQPSPGCLSHVSGLRTRHLHRLRTGHSGPLQNPGPGRGQTLANRPGRRMSD